MKIFLGADHNGYHMKGEIAKFLIKRGYDVQDEGDTEYDAHDDFPAYAKKAAFDVLAESKKDDARAILICGSGQGMCMAANRVKGIRAALVWDPSEAKITRNDNDSNVLCLPARVLQNEPKKWQAIVVDWLETPFAGAARYNRRNKQLDKI